MLGRVHVLPSHSFGELSQYPFIVVGSGFSGLTVAEQIASRLNVPVLILEKRNHIGGNAYSVFDEESGIEIHSYGSHLFHTNNEGVWEYANRFTNFTNYEHRVKTISSGKVYSMPINLHTINQFLNKVLTPQQAEEWITQCSLEITNKPENFEEKAITLMGRPLYENFIKGYTQKQWQTDPRDLPASIISRMPINYNYDDRYFSDRYQGLPMDGYASWLTNMVKHSKIEVALETDFFELKHQIQPEQKVIYTGPVDRYFNFSHGALTWRTLNFELESLEIPSFQGNAVINYADADIPFTRIHEFKHLHPERIYTRNKTIISREYSRFANFDDEPFYPINTEKDRKILNKYREMADLEKNVHFIGRLGRYQYLDMHMAISSALVLAQEFIELAY